MLLLYKMLFYLLLSSVAILCCCKKKKKDKSSPPSNEKSIPKSLQKSGKKSSIAHSSQAKPLSTQKSADRRPNPPTNRKENIETKTEKTQLSMIYSLDPTCPKCGKGKSKEMQNCPECQKTKRRRRGGEVKQNRRLPGREEIRKKGPEFNVVSSKETCPPGTLPTEYSARESTSQHRNSCSMEKSITLSEDALDAFGIRGIDLEKPLPASVQVNKITDRIQKIQKKKRGEEGKESERKKGDSQLRSSSQTEKTQHSSLGTTPTTHSSLATEDETTDRDLWLKVWTPSSNSTDIGSRQSYTATPYSQTGKTV